MVAVGDVVKVKGGGTPSKSRLDFYQGDIPWVTPKDMKFWRIESSIDMITQDAIANSATNLVPANSVLLVNRSGILKHTLPVGIAQRPVAINQDIKALIFSDRCDPQYAAHIIKASEQIVLGWVRATTADNFPIQNLIEMPIPLPPLDDQRRIAGILDAADALRRRRREALALLDTLPAAIFAEMFGDLTTSGDFPRGPISDLITDFDTGKNLAPASDEEGTRLRVLKVSAVTKGEFIESESKPLPAGYIPPEAHFVRPGDLLFSRANTSALIGATALVETVSDNILLPDKIWRFLFEHEKADPIFVHYLFGTMKFRDELSRRATGSSGSIKNISKGKVLSIEVGQPSFDQQQEFSRRVRVARGIRTQISKHLTELETLFASLQSRAFAGEL